MRRKNVPEARIQPLNDERDRIIKAFTPQAVPIGGMVTPATGQTVVNGQLGLSTDTLDADADRFRKTGQLPPNMSRSVQGQRQSNLIRQRAEELEKDAGGDPKDWPSRWQDFRASGIGKAAAERVRANREENLGLILRATEAAIPAALEASKALPRSDFVPFNKLIQQGQVMTSNPRLLEFGMANLQLAEHWARAMNPTGVMRESDRDKALAFLSTAYGNNTYEAGVRQLEKQITREKAAVSKGETTVSATGAPVPGAVPDSEGWTTLPNGARIREVKQ